ncbi:asparagine synthase (glutamine-hydrolyzing) [Methyloceanibacter sp.]|uniref:asparagine synthase (glutamine-hydrolyzing) n=1 Tax=Methyloceanibacter sp. TaxID=1965321 RepID=UPI002D6CA3FC|nr:asparagine synthase (glutamine-hydrolyzing) [Methyloceanibacter sp.]HZP10137.1 asparagine synthase (glutamine-hydrolyzing) [Methyloceanibacter sp.]
MCGIAGVLDLKGAGEPDRALVGRMATALRHRGPDGVGYLMAPGIGMGNRRLAIVGVTNGQQPIFNEAGNVGVIANGELFDYPERKTELMAKGHVFRTDSDTELIVHLYEEYGETLFEHLRGQFAFVLVDFSRSLVLLGRDRAGICPLHWSRQGDRLYFGSEIKALFASGAVRPALDPRGLDHIFTFFAMGTQRTMFTGVQSLRPGHYLRIAFRSDGASAEIEQRCYWDLDFPDWGDEDDPSDEEALVDEFESVFSRAVEIRLRAEVPVVGYLSGGVDSAYVLATASKLRGKPLPSFTVRVPDSQFDETPASAGTAQTLGSSQTILEAGAEVIAANYARLIQAAESPVLDTSCAALLGLSRRVRDLGNKVVLTGEGADEAFAGYLWFKWREIARALDVGSFKLSTAMSLLVRKYTTPEIGFDEFRRIDAMIGGPHAQSILYNLVASSRHRYYSGGLKEQLGGHLAYEDLDFDPERLRRWHPLNRSLYFGYKVLLAGMLLTHKGDRITMANSVEARYPFLDEKVIALASRLHPRWKLRRGTKDKYLLRRAAERLLPVEVAQRRKSMFRLPLAESFFISPPPFVRDLMSEEALARTGYFDVASVRRDYQSFRDPPGRKLGTFVSLGLTGVMATQLWHHLFLGGGLCDLPTLDFGSSANGVRRLAA